MSYSGYSISVIEGENIKLDLACGQTKKEGFIGIDFANCSGVDIVYDLNLYPWNFIKNNSVEEIYCSHFVEHVADLMKFMNECYRILKPQGKMTVLCPYYNSMRCWQDPTHVRAISEATMLYYNKEWRENNKLDHYPITANFSYTYGYNFNPVGNWASRNIESQAFAIKHYMNVIDDIIFSLTAIK